MSSGVKKIFAVILTIVACIVVGALVLNVLLPNGLTSVVDAAEDGIYSGTKVSLNFNGNGHKGGDATTAQSAKDSTVTGAQGKGVDVKGFN